MNLAKAPWYRPMTLADVPALLDWYNDADLHKTANSTPFEPYTLDALTLYWKKKLSREHCRYFAVMEGDAIIGRVGLKKTPPHLDVAEFSILIGDGGNQSRGIGTIITKAMIAEAFSEPKVNIVRLYVRQDNKRAIRCYLKSGYRLVHSFTQNGVPTDMMQVERAEWRKSREEGTGQAG